MVYHMNTLFYIVKKNRIYLPKGYQDSAYQTKVLKEDLNGKKVWRISYQISGDQFEKLILDDQTIKKLSKEIVPFINN